MVNVYHDEEKCCWEACFFACSWSIWLSRNALVCKGSPLTVNEESIKTNIAFWVQSHFDLKVYTIEDFKRCLHGIRSLKGRRVLL